MKMLMLASAVPLILSIGSLPAHAEAIDLVTIGSSHNLGPGLGSITNVVSKKVTKGKKGLEGSVAIVSSYVSAPVEKACFREKSDVGGEFTYTESVVISTQDNGDIITAYLDPNPGQDLLLTSFICAEINTGYREIQTNRIIDGGTGEFANACGNIKFIGTGQQIGTNLTSLEGTQSGEIFLDPCDAPDGTRGCNCIP